MTPTPEEIEAMAARGWTWIPEARAFGAPETKTVYASVMSDVDSWRASYGTAGIGYGFRDRHASPLLAADEAETWIRGELGKLKFPWLVVAP